MFRSRWFFVFHDMKMAALRMYGVRYILYYYYYYYYYYCFLVQLIILSLGVPFDESLVCSLVAPSPVVQNAYNNLILFSHFDLYLICV